ncbi:hypothetical protein ISN45_Aa07g008940 [Arabidopsis thaliana x Arabidopsis arenosa]|uniref:Uncharacterized protein n=1 Tax=Arabidopsis thaliana x Arabidopsis arenosa TaxID=1240361 RepID=A0A8T1Y121_9BRAS|nr:hypothetical protein ISN45_Aa07g008940 [Arabidopsis thaliana x Arabidopsis arenosa]
MANWVQSWLRLRTGPDPVNTEDDFDEDFVQQQVERTVGSNQVASFGYINENEAAALKEAQGITAASEEAQAIENKSSDRTSHWEELLKDKYEVQQAEELNALAKRKRNGKQLVMYVEEDDLDGLEVTSDEKEEDDLDGLEVNSDEKEEADDAEPTVVKAPRKRKPRTVTKPYRKRARHHSGPRPLMEGEGESLKVLGFDKDERKRFSYTFMRYGLDNNDWKKFIPFIPRFKFKTFDEIKAYGLLFLKHMSEDIGDSSQTFSDGVPIENDKPDDVRVRIALLSLFKEKCKYLEDNPTKDVSPAHIYRSFQSKQTFWQKIEYDKILVRGVFKHGHGSWLKIIDDEEFRPVEEALCRRWGYPFPYKSLSGGEQTDSSLNNETGMAENNNAAVDKGLIKIIRGKLSDKVRRRVTVLEAALMQEYAENLEKEQSKARAKVMDTSGTSFVDADKEMLDGLPKNDPIISEEISAAAVNNKQARVEVVQQYNQRVNENSRESFQTYFNGQPLTRMLRGSHSRSAGTDHDVDMDAVDNVIVLD